MDDQVGVETARPLFYSRVRQCDPIERRQNRFSWLVLAPHRICEAYVFVLVGLNKAEFFRSREVMGELPAVVR